MISHFADILQKDEAFCTMAGFHTIPIPKGNYSSLVLFSWSRDSIAVTEGDIYFNFHSIV